MRVVQKKWAVIGASVSFVAGPGVVAGVIPWRLKPVGGLVDQSLVGS